MSQPEETRYLTLDLLLRSGEDLSPLVEGFGDRVFIVYNGSDEAGGFYAVLEPQASEILSESPEQHAQYMAGLVEELPASLLPAWLTCSERTFDFGFQGGTQPASISHDLSPSTLHRIYGIGVSARITIYPSGGA